MSEKTKKSGREYKIVSTNEKIVRPPIFADNFNITIFSNSVSIEAQKFQYHPFNDAIESGNLNVQESTEIMTSMQGLLVLKTRIDEIFSRDKKLTDLYSRLSEGTNK